FTGSAACGGVAGAASDCWPDIASAKSGVNSKAANSRAEICRVQRCTVEFSISIDGARNCRVPVKRLPLSGLGQRFRLSRLLWDLVNSEAGHGLLNRIEDLDDVIQLSQLQHESDLGHRCCQF